LAIIDIQLEKKHKSMQGLQGIEGTGRLSSRCPSAVELALLKGRGSGEIFTGGPL